MGRPGSALVKWVCKNRNHLQKVNTALFTVSLNASDPRSKARIVDKNQIQTFIDRTGWTPTVSKCFAGALHFSSYSPLLRFVMKRISKSVGGPTDTTKDYDLTKWDDVDSFLQSFLKKYSLELQTKNHLNTESKPEFF